MCEGLGLGVIFACPGPGPDIRGGPGGRDTVAGRPRMKPAWLVWPLLFGALAIFMVHHPMLLSGLRQVQTDPGDPRLINYLLEHTYRVLALKPGYTSCWEMPFFFPHRNVGAYTDVNLTVSPPYLLFRLLGFEPDTAFQLWMMSVTALNFLAFYLFLRRCLPVGAPAASLGAALFAAGSSRVQQAGHLQLLCVAFVVLALAAPSRLLDEDASDVGTRNPLSGRKTVLRLSLLFAAAVAQCYAGFYNAFFLAFTLTLAAIVLPFLPQLRRRIARLPAGHWRLILGLCLADAWPCCPSSCTGARLRVNWVCGHGRKSAGCLPRPQSWLNMGADSLLYGRIAGKRLFADIPTANEQIIGIGFLTPLATLIGLLIWRRKEWVRLPLAVSALVVALTTLWMGKYTLWRVVYDAYPAAGAIGRSPARGCSC